MAAKSTFDWAAFEAALNDELAVRRLAVLAIDEWKIDGWRAAAKPYRPAIGRLRDDPDESVRRAVESVLGHRRS
jgi:hypothetical protein